MLKLVGSLLLAMTGVVLAVSFCRFERKKLTVLDSFITLLFYIKGQIDCYGLPLCDILESEAQGAGLPMQASGDFGQILSSNRIYLDLESYRLLECFYSEFGSMYREEQLRRCDYYINALSERRRLLFDDLPSRTRIGSALCICSVIGILIILW